MRAEGSLPDELADAVIGALAELLELAASLEDLRLEGVSPMLETESWQ